MKDIFSTFVRERLKPKTLLITCGLPASCKTGIAEEISRMKGYVILRSDLIRLEVLKGKDIFDSKVAGDINNRLSVYEEMFKRADELATKSKSSVILDATFVTQDLRERAAEIAEKNDMSFVIMETNCPQEVALERIKRRSKVKYESNALTEEAYLINKTNFEPVNVNEIKKKFPKLNIIYATVNTCRSGMVNWEIIKEERR